MAVDRRWAVVGQTLAWSHQEGVEEARASPVEDREVQEMGSAVQGAMVELGLRETGCYGLGAACWVWVGERLLECLA